MKISLVLVITLLIVFNSYSQAPPKLPQGLGSKGTRVKVADQLSVDSALILAKDTIKLLSSDTGAIVSKNGIIYKWIKQGSEYIWRNIEGVVTNGVHKSGDTVKAGSALNQYNDSTIWYSLPIRHSLGGPATSIIITNTNRDSISINSSTGTQGPQYNSTSFLVNRRFYEAYGDTLNLQYGGGAAIHTTHSYDSTSTRFIAGNKFIGLPNMGFTTSTRFFAPRDSVIVNAGNDGQQASSFFGDFAIGETWGYNINITSNAGYPLAMSKSALDLQRELSRGRLRKMVGTGIAGYFSNWKNYQGTITSGTVNDSSYHSKLYGFYAASEYGLSSTESKTKILQVSKADTVIGFYAAPQYTLTNSVYNGYGFVSAGDRDYNWFAGRTRFGGVMQSKYQAVSDTMTSQVHIDSTLQIGSLMPGKSFHGMFSTEYWRQTGLTQSSVAGMIAQGKVIQSNYQFNSPASFNGKFVSALRTILSVNADSAVTVANNSFGNTIHAATIDLNLSKRSGYGDTSTFVGGITPERAAAALDARVSVNTTASSGAENIFTGYWSALNPTFQFQSFNKMDHAIWLNIGVGQYTGAVGNLTNGYGILINPFPTNGFITNKYAIYQAGVQDTVLINGKFKLCNLTAPSSTYNLLVHGEDSLVHKVPISVITDLVTADNGLTKTGNNIQLGGTLNQSTTINTNGNTTIWTGVNDGETSFSVVNTGTTNASAISGSATGTTSIGVSGSSSAYLGVFGSSTTSNGVQGQSSSGTGVVGSSTTGVAFSGQINPVSTNTIENGLTLRRTTSSGAGANGLGAAIQYELETATSGASQIAGTTSFEWTDATNATRTSRFSIKGINNSSNVTLATFDGNGNVTFGTTNSIVGTATNNDAVVGNVGEEFNSTVSTYTNYSTTATYQNIASITLTAGDWDLSAFFTYSSNSATITAAANAIFVISTTTASASGATEGKNIAYVPQAALLGTSLFSDAISPYRVSIASTTTYYLNSQATFTLGNPQFVGTIRARRVR